MFLKKSQIRHVINSPDLNFTRIIEHFVMHFNLKKLKILCFLLIAFTMKVSAPSISSLTVLVPEPVQPYKQLAFAVGMVETKGDTLAFNPVEAAAGIFQIRPIRLIDYNKRTGSSIARKDLFNHETSEKIFMFYADEIGPYNLELIAKRWNGSGRLTTYYWNRIKHFL